MEIATQIEKAETLRELHHRESPLLIPNAWDVMSARLFAAREFSAVATTSGGVAWSLGYADGEQLPLDLLLATVQRMAEGLSCPLTVDFESGYGASLPELEESITRLLRSGAVGVNLEDTNHSDGQLLQPEVAAERIAAARRAATQFGVPLVINARVDTYIHGPDKDDASACFAATLRRAKMYLAAGADCIYPIGLHRKQALQDLVRALACPINVMACPPLPNLAELAEIGVARVTTATRLTTIAYDASLQALEQIRASGSFAGLTTQLTRIELQEQGKLA